jgi:DNA-binding IclR family transcriptional regulator
MASRIGQSAPAHCTGVGKVLLSYMPPERLEQFLSQEKMQRYTEHTITDKSQLINELERIRQNGYAIDDEEYEVGIRCVAAPVRNKRGAVVAALSISIPTVRLPNSELPRYREYVINAADEITKRLGALL